MICSIMQPTYLPWAGYFNLIAQSDIFIFLDDSQYQKNSWHNRNKILVNHQPHWITVPVRHLDLEQPINQIEFDASQHWKKKHIELLRHTYSKHPFGDEILNLCSVIETLDSSYLADLNIALIRWFLKNLNIQTTILFASATRIEGKRSDRLIGLLNYVNADVYLSPIGAFEYLQQDNFAAQSQVDLKFQDYIPKPYKQYKHNLFQGYLSIVDVIANIGWSEARDYISNFH